MKKIKILYNILKIDEISLLKRSLKTLNKTGDTIRIEPFKRYGFSGAVILLVHFTQKGGVPFILKIHDKKSIEREYEAIQELNAYYTDTSSIKKPIYGTTKGVLIYNYFSSDGKLDSKTFEDLIYTDKVDETYALEILNTLYFKNINTAYSELKTQKVNWLQNYEWYLRKYESENTINIALNLKGDIEHVVLNNYKFINPILFLKKLDFDEKLNLGPIHGDLHANNIVISEANKPHLIDFAWATKKKHHVLIDFTLMECSLRFALLPKYLCNELVISLDKKLSCFSNPIDCSSCELKQINEKSINQKYICQCCKMVKEIRSHAKSIYKNDDLFNKHYSISLYIMLFGLVQYPQYLKERCILNLGFLSNEIKNFIESD